MNVPFRARIPYEACPLCDGAAMDEVAIGLCSGHPMYKPQLPPTQRWVQCRACQHVFVDGHFTEEALRLLFSDANPGQTVGHDLETTRYVWARILENVMSLRPALTGRWLDVGFGNGSLLTTAAEFGWEVAGLDLRTENVRQMRELGYDAHAVELTDFAPDAPFDVVSMADVLEHMAFPKPALRHTRTLLNDGGLLFLSMPNSDSFLWETLTRRQVNPYFGELEHYHNFGRKRLYALLEECGFAPRRYGVSFRYRACMEVIAEKIPV